MMPDAVVSFATFLIVFWLLNRLSAARRPEPEPNADAKRAERFIRKKIVEHAEALAQRYSEACEHDACGDGVPGRFAREIEAFIGHVLMRDVELEHSGLGAAVRELVTLEREHVYALVLACVQQHLIERRPA